MDICSRLGSIAIACVEVGVYVPCLRTAAENYVLPLVAKMLGDTDAAVRKSAFTALLQITKQRCVSRQALEIHVCPKVTHYTTQDAVTDYQTSAVTVSQKTNFYYDFFTNHHQNQNFYSKISIID